MSAASKEIVSSLARLRQLRRAMPLRDAVKATYASASKPEIRVFLGSIKRHVWLRTASMDLKCLEKVFIDAEYRPPFTIEPQLIVDAGANSGLSTLYFAGRYPRARIIAIEPEPSNFEVLRRNCTGLPNVIVLQAALWPLNGSLNLENLTAGTRMSAITSSNLGGAVVKAITIADILEGTRHEQIDFLNLDIDGSEFTLFSNGAERWIDRVGTMAVKLHDRSHPGCAKAFYSLLASKNFSQEIQGERVFVKLVRDDNKREAIPERSAGVVPLRG
jgi:FkbM family methyltransferase